VHLRLRSAALRILSAVVGVGIAFLVGAPATVADAIMGDLSGSPTFVRAGAVADVTLTFTAPGPMGGCTANPPGCEPLTGGALGIGFSGAYSSLATSCGTQPTWNNDYLVWETEEVLPGGGSCTFTIYGWQAPAEGGLAHFWSWVAPNGPELGIGGAGTGPDAIVRVLAPDGTGQTAIAATGWTSAQELTAGATTTLTLTYTAAGGGLLDGAVTFTLPDDWSTPAGHVSSTMPVATDGHSIVVSVADLAGYDSFDVTYTGTVGSSTDFLGWRSFTTKERSNSAGILTETVQQTGVKVRPPDGSGTVTVNGEYGIPISLSHIKMAAGREAHLQFYYTPDGFLGDGSELTLTVPDTWPAPQTANENGQGYVKACGYSDCTVLPRAVTVTGHTIHVDAHSSQRGMPLTIWYTGTAPGGETTEDWVVTEKSTAEGTLTAVETSPSVSREVPYITAFSVDGPELGPFVAGTSIPVSIYAFTQFWFVDTTFENSVQLTATARCSAGCGTTPRFTHGVLENYHVTVTQTGTGLYLTATLPTGTRPWGDSYPFDVLPAAATHATFTSPTTQLLAGRVRTLTVEVRDRFENVETGDDATQVTFTRTTGPGSVTGLGPATVTHGVASLDTTGGAPGSVTIQAAAPGLPPATTTFTVVPDVPTVAGFAPAQGVVGATVTLSGVNFTRATAVTLNGASAAFTVLSDTRLTFQVPNTTTGTIAVTTPSGTGTSSGAFTVILPPTITDMTPAEGAVHATVTLTGTNFAGTTSVTVHGTSAPFTVVSNTTLTFTVPPGATTGPITVTNPAGSATTGGSFVVTAGPAITGFSPGSGPVGTVVTVTGEHLLGTVAVQLGTVLVVPLSVADGAVTFLVPPGTPGGHIKVVTLAGSAVSTGTFTVT
jgi:hypothetical protein